MHGKLKAIVESARVFGLAAGLSSCAGAETAAKPAALPYAENVRWVCMPGAAFDACKTELTATSLAPDGTRVLAPHHAAKDPKVDCFYVYPTVDLDLVPGNHDDFSDTRKEQRTTLAQVGRFTEACAVWAPLYRQVTIGTYLRSKERLERGLAMAFSDVEAAFREFIARTDPHRKIVLVGHSQGAEMVVRLLKTFFDHDALMRDRLLLAMPIGGDFETAPGKATGGTLENVPVCTKPNEVGCVVAYRSYAGGDVVTPQDRWRPSAGHTSACVNPASIDGGSGLFAKAYFPLDGDVRRFMRGVDGIETPYVVVPDYYMGKCVTQPSGFAYLEVSEAPRAGDTRRSVVDLHKRMMNLGLHILDLQLTQGDLVEMVARRAATLP